jgi:hypothetical protein
MPPEGLSERAQELWRAEVRHRTKSSGRLALLEQCLRALDRADEVHRLLGTQELISVTKTTGAAHLNPLLRAEKEARETFARLAGMLGLQWNNAQDGESTAPTPYQSFLERNRQKYERARREAGA